MPKPRSTKLAKTLDRSGWKIVDRPAAADRPRRAYQADAAAPALEAVQAKYFGKAKPAVKKAVSSKKHSQFITVVPKNLPDNAGTFRKTMLVKGDKVLFVQG